jgi:hypothetical protein
MWLARRNELQLEKRLETMKEQQAKDQTQLEKRLDGIENALSRLLSQNRLPAESSLDDDKDGKPSF